MRYVTQINLVESEQCFWSRRFTNSDHYSVGRRLYLFEGSRMLLRIGVSSNENPPLAYHNICIDCIAWGCVCLLYFRMDSGRFVKVVHFSTAEAPQEGHICNISSSIEWDRFSDPWRQMLTVIFLMRKQQVCFVLVGMLRLVGWNIRTHRFWRSEQKQVKR